MSARCFDNASCLQQNLYKMNGDDFPKIPQFEKQGIVSILSSDFTTPNKILSQPLHNSSNSIRRTLSADMSSPKWLHSNGFPPVKRVKSSLQLQQQQPLGHDHHHDFTNGPPAIDDVWSSIQAEKQSWGCILSPQNNDGSGSGSDPGHATPPYVHPLAKRSGSSLSEKSLEICTESLGSETGSDGFSYPLSEPEDSEHEEEEDEAEVYEEQVNHQVVNNNRGPTTVTATVTSKRSMMFTATRPLFPPPLPSLGNRDDGSNLHIRSHRQDGRLVVEAVSVPSQNCFRAQRQDGRLLLTFSNKYGGADDEDDDEDDEEKTEKKVEAAVVEVGMKRRSTTTMMMNKFTELSNKSATWPRNYNKTVIKTLNNHHHHHEEEEVHGGGMAAKATVKQSLPSLPPRPITTKSTAVLNGYEYYWRRNTTTNNNTTVGMLKPLANAGTPHNHNNNNDNNNNNNNNNDNNNNNNNNNKRNQIHNNRRRMGGVEYGDVAPWMMLRGCKEAKKPSLLLWEPYCIATS